MADQKGIEIKEKHGVFFISGAVDEFARFEALDHVDSNLKLNFKNATRFNSIGIRNLLNFLSRRGLKPYSFVECPSEFIDQVNMIPGLLGETDENGRSVGQILSFYLPLECESCESTSERYIESTELSDMVAQAKNGQEITYEAPCSQCEEGVLRPVNEAFLDFLLP